MHEQQNIISHPYQKSDSPWPLAAGHRLYEGQGEIRNLKSDDIDLVMFAMSTYVHKWSMVLVAFTPFMTPTDSVTSVQRRSISSHGPVIKCPPQIIQSDSGSGSSEHRDGITIRRPSIKRPNQIIQSDSGSSVHRVSITTWSIREFILISQYENSRLLKCAPITNGNHSNW